MARGAVIALLLACILKTACANVVEAAAAAGATQYVDFAKASGATAALTAAAKAEGNRVVVIAPTNAAFDAWLKSTKANVKELLQRKVMAQRLISFLTLETTGADVAKIPKGSAKAFPTFNSDFSIRLLRATDGSLHAIDSHGNVAVLTPTKNPNVFTADNMLLSGHIYTGLPQFEEELGHRFSLLALIVKRSGATIKSSEGGRTHFVPTDEAFQAAGMTKQSIEKMDPAELKKLIAYHSVPGYRSIPRGFVDTNGRPIGTELEGANITVDMTAEKGVGRAVVIDAAGNTAKVVAPNLFLMHATFHAVDRVLSWKPSAAAAVAADKPAAATASAAAPAEKPAADAAAKPEATAAPAAAAKPAAAAAKPEATAAPNAAAPKSATAAAGGRRRLKQAGGSGGDKLENDTMLATLNAQDAVRAALNSDTTPVDIKGATDTAHMNAAYAGFPTDTSGFFQSGGPGGLNSAGGSVITGGLGTGSG